MTWRQNKKLTDAHYGKWTCGECNGCNSSSARYCITCTNRGKITKRPPTTKPIRLSPKKKKKFLSDTFLSGKGLANQTTSLKASSTTSSSAVTLDVIDLCNEDDEDDDNNNDDNNVDNNVDEHEIADELKRISHDDHHHHHDKQEASEENDGEDNNVDDATSTSSIALVCDNDDDGDSTYIMGDAEIMEKEHGIWKNDDNNGTETTSSMTNALSFVRGGLVKGGEKWCLLNSVVQILASIKGFVLSLANKMSTNAKVNSKHFKRALGKVTNLFPEGRQHDAEELFRITLEFLMEDYNFTALENNIEGCPIETPIKIMMRQLKTCYSCGISTPIDDIHSSIQIELQEQNDTTLCELWDLHFDAEPLLDVECTTCCKKQDCTNQYEITKWPEIKRFHNNNWITEKIHSAIEFGKTWHIHSEKGERTCQLIGIINHHGRTWSSGHHTADADMSHSHVNESSKWMSFDASVVKEVDEDKVITESASVFLMACKLISSSHAESVQQEVSKVLDAEALEDAAESVSNILDAEALQCTFTSAAESVQQVVVTESSDDTAASSTSSDKSAISSKAASGEPVAAMATVTPTGTNGTHS